MQKLIQKMQRILGKINTLVSRWVVHKRRNKLKKNRIVNVCYKLAGCFILCLFYASCSSTRGVYIDGCGDARVRESFGELKEREQAIDDEERRLNELSREIENSVGKERRVIERLEELIRRIRERNKESDERNE